jgi:hypothetical protein
MRGKRKFRKSRSSRPEFLKAISSSVLTSAGITISQVQRTWERCCQIFRNGWSQLTGHLAGIGSVSGDADSIGRADRDERGARMDPKVLLLFALLTPVLILAAGMFAGRKEEK